MNDSPGLIPSPRTRLRRFAARGQHTRADLDAVLAAGFVCHLGVIVDTGPMVVPTVYGSDGRHLYVHGSVASRSLVAAPDATICVTVTHIDGLVIARSTFEHSVNYRSAMIYGTPRVVVDEDEKLAGLRCVTEQAVPGQWDYARRPNRKELAATTLLALSLDEASVKIRTGGPEDGDSPDAELDVWAGVLPMSLVFGAAEPDSALRRGIALPAHLADR